MNIFEQHESWGKAGGALARLEAGQPETEQMVSQPNAEIALKSLMDAELALTKARDLLRRCRNELFSRLRTDDSEAILADINDLLGG